jgi:hypothetical protein
MLNVKHNTENTILREQLVVSCDGTHDGDR